MSRDLKGLLRYALEHSDGTSDCKPDPERAQWLKEALSSFSVDLTQRLKLDIEALTQMLNGTEAEVSEMENVLQDLISLTEDIDLAKDFFKLGGISVLHSLLNKGPPELKTSTYELLAAVSQNNPASQEICAQSHFLQKLIRLLPSEKDLECLKKLLLAISCLARGYPPGVAAFLSSNGFEVVLDALSGLLHDQSKPDISRVCAKGAFLVYSLLQEVLPSFMSLEEAKRLATRLVHFVMQLKDTQEHLLASLIFLFTNSSSIENAIDVENASSTTIDRTRELLSQNDIAAFVEWLRDEDEKITSSADPAHSELRTYIGTLLQILSVRT